MNFTFSTASPSLSLRTDMRAYSLLDLTILFFSLVPITRAGTRILTADNGRGWSQLAIREDTWVTISFTSFESFFNPWKDYSFTTMVENKSIPYITLPKFHYQVYWDYNSPEYNKILGYQVLLHLTNLNSFFTFLTKFRWYRKRRF